jgi:F-type H+-transporting ATPase subunit gamma
MASTKDLKRRIGSVKNTQQTTRAMKVVSAAKLRRAQEAIANHRPYARKVAALIRELASGVNPEELQLPLLKPAPDGLALKRILLVVVTSDRGLCGGFNGNVIKACLRWISEHGKQTASVELVFVGRKGYEFFKSRPYKIGGYLHTLAGKVNFSQSKKTATQLTERFLSGEIDEIKFIYNEFKNAVSQQVVVGDYLPFVMHPEVAIHTDSSSDGSNFHPDSLVRPSRVAVLNELLQSYCIAECFRILLESQAGEHGARMSAMENATKNAGEMIRKLTLQYNKQRQAGITKELLEIISGSESQKG